MNAPVCITGATGFIGSHIVDAFLRVGVPVHAAVRSPDDPNKVGPLKALAERHGVALTLFSADLTRPGSFDEAAQGCEGMIHVAASVRLAAPDPQRQIVDPSVEGTKNVLDAATRAGVRRVVLTSSVAAVGSYRDSQDHPLTEDDWNDGATLQSDPYGLAKTSAERLAWRRAAEERWELVTCNPAMVLGPVMTARHSKASPMIVRALLTGAYPAIPKMCFGIVDVRDVAEAHVAAFQRPEAEGRHILCAGSRWMRELAELLRARVEGVKITRRALPNFAMQLFSLFDKRLSRSVLKDILGREPRYVGTRATSALGVSYRDIDETIEETARSMIELGFVTL